MNIRNYTLLFLSLLSTLPLFAQTFVSLKWQDAKVVSSDLLSEPKPVIAFDGSFCFGEDRLPYYGTVLSIGTDYADYSYDVQVEFPEFQQLTSSERTVLLGVSPSLPTFPVTTSSLGVSAKNGLLNVRFIPLVYRAGIYYKIVSFKLKLTKTKLTHPVKVAASASRYTKNSALTEGRWMKIRVSGTGVYRITHSELAKMGFRDPAKVRLYGYGGFLLHEDFMKPKIDDLPEIPLYRASESMLFYANGTIRWEWNGADYIQTQNYFSTHSYYFLTESEGTPAVFPTTPSLPDESAMEATTFPDYALYENDSHNWATSGREMYDSYDYALGATKTYEFTLPGITSEDASVAVDFSAYSPVQTSVKMTIDGANMETFKINGIPSGINSEYTKGTSAFKRKVWQGTKGEKTRITLTHNRNSSVSGRLNYIRINYNRKLELRQPFMAFRLPIDAKTKFSITNANANMQIWDVTSATDYRKMEGNLSDGIYSFITSSPKGREFVAVNVAGEFGKVEVVGEIANQNLHALEQTDMVIIVPNRTDFKQQAERLAKVHRENDHLRIHIVSADQIYNEFSSGTPDATAYRSLMKMFYDRSSSVEDAPKYLLLFGDCTWDNRMISSTWKSFQQSDFLLCYESPNSLDETKSYVTDDYFGFLDDWESGSPLKNNENIDIGIGRFPVRTAVQATDVVDKIIAYMDNKETGSWKNMLCFVADDGDSNGHTKEADEVATYIENNHPEFLIKRIYTDTYKREISATGSFYPLAHRELMEQFSKGALIVNYTGHGSTTAWTAEGILQTSDIVGLRSPRLPFWLTATCDFGRYDAADNSAGELAFLNKKGGAIALLTTSRVVYSAPNLKINKAFAKHSFLRQNGKRLRLGDIVRMAKCDGSLTSESDRINTFSYVLIGDPALTLAYPEYKMIVDEFNGKPAATADNMIKAGSIVNVKGRVVNEDGQTLTDYFGMVNPTVYDNLETVTAPDQNSSSSSTPNPYSFKARTKSLYVGSDSIRAGVFNFSFPVPMDINYSNLGGLLNLYASESSTHREGQGIFDNFLVGGTDESMKQDTLGPKITAIYFNSPDFAYGGKVNETPVLFIHLEDSDGINMTGSGIGHDLIAIVDGNTSHVLNSYYTTEPGDYAKGTIRYIFPELSEGKHKLLFRAWDVKNNSSITTLDFEVVRGLRPQLFAVECTNSPAKVNTTFILSHNRPESDLAIRLSVCDFAGRELWVHTEQGASDNNQYLIDWDLTSNGGQRLGAGVYLFRASITTPSGGKESTQARKIVILAQ